MIEADDTKGTFEFRPLEPGFGITIGNALRRIMLSSLEGYAITSIKIEGVDQEFSTIKSVVEDVSEMILNFKKIRFRRQIDTEISEKVPLLLVRGVRELNVLAMMVGALAEVAERQLPLASGIDDHIVGLGMEFGAVDDFHDVIEVVRLDVKHTMGLVGFLQVPEVDLEVVVADQVLFIARH